MTTHTDYDSAAFEADLGKVEDHLTAAFEILAGKQFRDHLIVTEENFGANGLIYEWAGIMTPLGHVNKDFFAFAERIRTL